MNNESSLYSILSKLLFAIKYIAIIVFSVYLSQNPNTIAMADETIAKQPYEATLSPMDCQKCHSNIVILIEVDGAAHQNKITCIDCHEGHPPRKRDIIPHCSKCHHESPDTLHFGLENCLGCHQNPHTPLKITLTKNMTAPCLTCHTSQIEELREHPSIHTSLDCTACHTRHGFLPKCFACHAPHLQEMTLKDCLSCHRPHMPLVVTYGPDTPSESCGACHGEVYALIATSKAKHRKIPCVQCHEAKHKMVPKCQKCHALPHTKSIHDKFPECGTCHGIAHNLHLNRIDIFLENN